MLTPARMDSALPAPSTREITQHDDNLAALGTPTEMAEAFAAATDEDKNKNHKGWIFPNPANPEQQLAQTPLARTRGHQRLLKAMLTKGHILHKQAPPAQEPAQPVTAPPPPPGCTLNTPVCSQHGHPRQTGNPLEPHTPAPSALTQAAQTILNATMEEDLTMFLIWQASR